MNPISETFKTRLRMFPALVNCCYIDLFREWPTEALVSVASNYYKEAKFSNDDNR